MSTTTEQIVINSDNTVDYVKKTVQRVQVGEDVLAALQGGAVVKAFHLFTVGDQPVSASLSTDGYHYFQTRLRKLTLRTRYHCASGILTPDLARNNNPVMSLEWKAPENMRLIFLVGMIFDTDYPTFNNCWLLARDNNNRYYRLPLGNLYADCKVCTGEFPKSVNSFQEMFQNTLDQLVKSEWNSDLWDQNGKTSQLFRFKADKQDIVQIDPAVSDWTTACEKVAPAVISRIVI